MKIEEEEECLKEMQTNDFAMVNVDDVPFEEIEAVESENQENITNTVHKSSADDWSSLALVNIATGDDIAAFQPDGWLLFSMRLCASVSIHPFEYAKTLIQLGYEPLPAKMGESFFGKPMLMLPNLFKYVRHIKSVDGVFGCFRGLSPKLIGSIVGAVGSEQLVAKLGLLSQKDETRLEIADIESYEEYEGKLKRDVVVTVSSTVLSHPFHVISLRMMAQFIGRETFYKSICGSILEIYKNEGFAGFFAGILPKLLCDVSCVVLTESTVYLLRKYCRKGKIDHRYSAAITQYIFAGMLYPLQVVSTCMTVTGSRLMAGRPPCMPKYKSFIDCWLDLDARGESKRGNSFFCRSIPVIIKPAPLNSELLTMIPNEN